MHSELLSEVLIIKLLIILNVFINNDFINNDANNKKRHTHSLTHTHTLQRYGINSTLINSNKQQGVEGRGYECSFSRCRSRI